MNRAVEVDLERSTRLRERAQAVLAGGAVNILRWPGERVLIAEGGEGATLYGADGTAYRDFLLGSGPLILGHSHARVVAAARAQAAAGSSPYSVTEPAITLGERITTYCPCAEVVRFCSSGSEATFFALRIARAATGRSKVLKFEGAFHGGHDYALMSLTPRQSLPYPHAEASSAGIPESIKSDVLIAPFNDPFCAREIAARHAGSLAAIIVEPVQRALVPESSFLAELRDIASEYGALLVFDEVVTGFRLGLGGAQGYYRVVPDLAAYGKIIGGGFPIGAVAGARQFMEMIGNDAESAYVSGTFAGNPVSAAAGVATVDELAAPGVYELLFDLGDQLRTRVEKELAHGPKPAVVVGIGPMFQIVFRTSRPRNYRELADADHAAMQDLVGFLFDRGILYSGKKGYLSTAHTEEDVEAFAVAIAQWVKQL